MRNCIFVIGSDGYIGNAITQRLLFKGFNVLGFDNFSRRNFVHKQNSNSAISHLEPLDKIKKLKKYGFYKFNAIDIAKDTDKFNKIVEKERPETIINLAHMPSGPWSMIDEHHSSFSLMNNIIGTNTILWAIKNHCPDCHYITIGTTGEYDHYNNIDIEEGYFSMEWNGRQSNEMIFPRRPGSVYHSCYDEQTEVLTKNGWKFFKDLLNTDEVATLNHETDTLEHQIPTNIFKYEYNDDLISINTKSLDLFVTPNHKLFEHSNHKSNLKNWRLTEAKDLYDKSCVMRRSVSNWVGSNLQQWVIPSYFIDNPNQYYDKGWTNEITIDIEKWIMFFGWWITEGSIYKNNIHIPQQKDYNFQEIIDVMSIFDRKIQTNIKHGKTHGFSIKNVQLASYLKQFGTSKTKFIPIEIKNLPKHHLKTLLDIMIKGNGWINDNSKKYHAHFYTISKQLADDIQEIALKCGYVATINHYDRYNEREYNVSITENATTQIIMSNSVNKTKQNIIYSKKHYNGKVYCCEVDNSIIYVRRNGKPIWCGNSKVASTYLIDFLTRSWGLYCTDIMQAVVFGSYTKEIDETKIYSRFDIDECFGTALNRFICQAKSKTPLTIYGKGDHKRGFLSLNDSVQALEIAVNNRPKQGKAKVWNQLSEWHSINNIAKMVQRIGYNKGYDVKTKKIKTPRNEITNDHYYLYKTDILKSLGYKPTRTIEQEIKYCFDIVEERKFTDPKITWS